MSDLDNILAYVQRENSPMMNPNGTQNRDSPYRAAFWDGYNGLKRSVNAGDKTSLTYQFFLAGQKFKESL